MIGGECATSFGQFCHGEHAGPVYRLRVEVFPYLVQIDQPVEELGILHCGQIARQGLVEVMVRVYKAWDHHVTRGVDDGRAFGIRKIGTDFGDAIPFDQDIYSPYGGEGAMMSCCGA